MILDFRYVLDKTGKLVSESGGLRKYLLPILKKHKVGDLLSTFSMVLFEKFYNEKLLVKKNRYNIDEASNENLQNIIWELGHTLTIGDNYTNSDEYFRRQARTLSARIQKKHTRFSYVYLFYVYGFKYNFSYRANVVNGESYIRDILEGTENITIGATVYGKGIAKDTFVIAKTTDTVLLSNPINLGNMAVGFGLIYSFYNEDIDVLRSAPNPPNSLETLKGLNISDLVDLKNISLDFGIFPRVEVDVTNLLIEAGFSDSSFYSSYDSPAIKKYGDVYYLTYDYLSLDGSDPLFLRNSTDTGSLPINLGDNSTSAWYLDNANIAEVTTRHFLLNYIMSSVENDNEFLTKQSNVAFYNDVLQNKRKIEVPHFEPKLNLTIPVGTVPPNPLNIIKYPNLYTYTTSTGVSRVQGKLNFSATMQVVCFDSNLNSITHIQFGTGRRNLDFITQEQMDSNLNDNINNLAVAGKFVNEDLSLNEITKLPSDIEKNKYRFINPLSYQDFINLLRGATLPDLDQSNLDDVNEGVVTSAMPYYQLTKENRYSFPIEYFRIDKFTEVQLILRNILFPYFKWSSFSEIAFLSKLPNGEYRTVMYATFPKVTYASEMLSSIYLNIFLDYNFEEIVQKLTFTFKDTDWEQVNSSSEYYLIIPYFTKLYSDYNDYKFEYVRSENNDPSNIENEEEGIENYFFQNLGYNPMVYIFKETSIEDAIQYEYLKVNGISNLYNGSIKIRINTNIISPFSGKIVIL